MKAGSSAASLFVLIVMLCISAPGFSEKASTSTSETGPGAGNSNKESPEPQSEQTYIIRRGDSLAGIAKAFHTSPDALKTLNNLSGNRIVAGQTLTVPGDPASGDQVEAAGNKSQNYTVNSGDNLYSIAKSFHTTVNAIKRASGLKGSGLKIGQVLKIPVSQSAAAEVRPGVNVAMPASADTPVAAGPPQQPKPDLSPAMDAAKLTPEEASRVEHMLLRLKDQGDPEAGGPPETSGTDTLNYTVISGDSLYSIAKSFQTTVNTLKRTNGLKSSRLQVGRILKVPAPQNPHNIEADVPPAENVAMQVPVEALSEAGAPETVMDAANPTAEAGAQEEKEPTLRERLVEAGFKMLGVRYRYSGTSEKTGLDCSALVRNVFSKFNITLPRSSREQFKQGEKIDRDNLQAGDLVFFSSGGKTPTHVGIYVGNNQFLHAARKARQVIVSDLNKIWYNTRYLGARRIMDLWFEDSQNSPEPQ